ncbi:hypothetical protein DNTS_025644 [Danionella cerebrum]|uniref:Uncharacterized protein n=1 Tax=Danionella cerebrum TaxID=2873325 RepID=A0A553MRK0_9TELE|nr:hypothetical protein DNTS_025644 [Danionella translucida]
MHQKVFDYIHVEERQEFRRQLHWAMDPKQDTDEEALAAHLYSVERSDGINPEMVPFLSRCFIARVRCLLDSTSGFLSMQFQGGLKFLQGQRRRTQSGALMPPQLALFCVAVPLVLPSITQLKMKSLVMKSKQKSPGGSDKRQRVSGGSFDSEDVPPYNWTSVFGHDPSWAPNRKFRGEEMSFHASCQGASRSHADDEASWDPRSPVALRSDSSDHYQGYKHSRPADSRIDCSTEFQKLERTYMMQKECFSMIPEAAIKTEQDSDSENGCSGYGTLWRPEYSQVKSESDYYDYCHLYQRGKAVYNNGGNKYLHAGVDRSIKYVLYKESYSDGLIGSQEGYTIPNEHKRHAQRVAQEFRSHNIKQEPEDSAARCYGTHAEHNFTSNCTVNNVLHKANPYVYMQ